MRLRKRAAFAMAFASVSAMAGPAMTRATDSASPLTMKPSAKRRLAWLSVAFFLGAQHDATVPLLALPAALAADARGPTSDPDNPLFQHVGTNYLKGRLRSHPDVAKRHYSDLIDTQTPCNTEV